MAETPLSAQLRPSPTYLEGLNPAQREAVETTEGPVLMLAGAGTGKTRALTTRLAHILMTDLARPWEMLAVTFTNKAAREMRERIGDLIGESVEGMQWLGTFHAISAQILRRHAELVGLKSNFSILDADDQIRLAKQVISAAGIDDKRWTGRALAALIDGWKNRGYTPGAVPAEDSGAFADGRGAELYRDYQERLRTLNGADFGDLLLHCLTIFQTNTDVLELYQSKFRYIMVDEYQDTNVAQYLWLRLLAQKTKNICCVGDDDQSIYGWRGAEVRNILRFEQDFPGAKIIRLERNYRSTAPILNAASGLIRANESRLGKTLYTEAEGGDPVRLYGVWDDQEEARRVGDEIESLQSKGRKLSDIAVLVRASFQMRAFEECFLRLGLNYRVVGGPRFFEREEVRDAHAYLRLVKSQDDDLAFERIVNKPRRGIGEKAVQTLHRAARDAGVSLMHATRMLIESDELRGAARNALTGFVDMVDRWSAELNKTPHTELAEVILDESGYTAMWQNERTPQAEGKLENLKELIRAMGEFDTLAGYLDHVSLVMELDQNSGGDRVNIMTLHSAKGLEFPVVFLPGWEEGVFPSQRSLDEKGKDGLEEERRLAYVGITRAREDARILFAANRQVYGRIQTSIPSRFIDELPKECVEVLSEPGLYGASASSLQASNSFDGMAEEAGSYYNNPGWRRARNAGARSTKGPARKVTIDGSAELIATSAEGASKFAVGDRVFHQKFGYGRVSRVEGNKLSVHFDTSGDKRVIDSFVAPG